jgi:hypothetical protein
MRFLLILTALAACDKTTASKVPDTVVLVDELWNRVRVEKKPAEKPVEFWFGCELVQVRDNTVIRCPNQDFFVRFRCRDIAGPDRAISFFYKGESYQFYCR